MIISFDKHSMKKEKFKVEDDEEEKQNPTSSHSNHQLQKHYYPYKR